MGFRSGLCGGQSVCDSRMTRGIVVLEYVLVVMEEKIHSLLT